MSEPEPALGSAPDPANNAATSPDQARRRQRLNWITAIVGVVAVVVLFWLGGRGAKTSAVLDYSTFMQRVEAGEVDKITIDPDGPVVGTQTDGTAFTSQIPTAPPEDLFLNLGEHGVTIAAKGPSAGWPSVLLTFAPVVLLVGYFLWMSRRASGAGGSALGGFGRAKAELLEVVDYLRRPER